MATMLEPLQLGFMQTALLGSLIIGVTCSVLGVYVVLRRMAFFSDAVAHTALPGLVAAYIQGWSLLGGAVVASVMTALGIGWLSQRGAMREDTAIGVVFTGLFALGIAMISATRSFRDVSAMLFGNILGITESELVLVAGVAVVVLLVLFALHKELELTSFDPIHAHVAGINPDVVRYVLLVLLALAVVAGIQAVGVVLVSGLLITPAAAASLLTNRLPRMMLVAMGISVIASFGGLYASYFFNVSSGAAIVLACTACFVLAWLIRWVPGVGRKRSAVAQPEGQ